MSIIIRLWDLEFKSKLKVMPLNVHLITLQSLLLFNYIYLFSIWYLLLSSKKVWNYFQVFSTNICFLGMNIEHFGRSWKDCAIVFQYYFKSENQNKNILNHNNDISIISFWMSSCIHIYTLPLNTSLHFFYAQEMILLKQRQKINKQMNTWSLPTWKSQFNKRNKT